MAEQIVEQISAKIRKEAYHQGWIDATAAAGAAIADTLTKCRPVPFPTSSSFSSETKRAPFRKGSDMAALFEYMKSYPGLSGAALVKGLNQLGVDIKERTARTALHRMKKRGFAANNGGKWFVK